MNDPCPDCGLVFQREEGYFLGAMYVSSVLSMVAATPIYFTLAHFLPEVDSILLALTAFARALRLSAGVARRSQVAGAKIVSASGFVVSAAFSLMS